MGLTSVAIRRPLFMLMVILAIVVFGLISYTRLGLDLNPNVNFPVVTIVTVYPGAGPEAVDRLVTQRVEEAVAGINGIDYIQSSSSRGVSNVTVVFKDGTDADTVSIEVERKVSAASGTLPSEAERPTVIKADLEAEPVLQLALSGTRPLDQLQRVADDSIKERLASLEGVSQVNVYGGLEREVQVRVDQQKLRARGITLDTITRALGSDNLDAPSGKLTEGERDFNIRLDVRYTKPEDLENVILEERPGRPVYLRDVATVEDTFKDQSVIQRVDGKASVGITVVKAADANTVQVVEEVKKELALLQAEMPPGVTLDVVLDTSVFIEDSLTGLQSNLVEAVALTGLVMLVFLHTLRSTFIVLLAIPTSMIATFIMMYVMGFSLNQMSMMALALCVGILVDDSIVVLENISRHLKLGETPWTAALKGRSEIGMAAIAITLVDVVVFTPVAFMSGIVGQFFRQFGLVVAAATLFSLFVSFTLTPLLASRWLRPPKPKSTGPRTMFGLLIAAIDSAGAAFDRGFNRLERGYRVLLGGALRFRWAVLVLGFASFAGGITLVMFGLVGTEFFPRTDQGQFALNVEMPPGTSVQATSAAVRQVEEQLMTWPEVDRVFTTVGSNEARFASISVKMKPRAQRTRGQEEVANAARQLNANIPGMEIRAAAGGFGGGGSTIQIQITGTDRTELTRMADQVEASIRDVPGLTDVNNSSVAGELELVVTIDRQRASDLGLTAAQVAGVLRTSVEGTVATQFRPASGDDVDVRVRLNQGELQQVQEIRDILVRGSGGQAVRLSQIADIREAAGPPSLDRRDRLPVVTVGGEPFGRPVGDVSADVLARLQTIPVPAGYDVKMGGEVEAQQESFAQIFSALGLSVVLMYMLMVALFESLLFPLMIILALPLAVVGAIGALALTGNSLNIMSMIGMIMLMGLVGKNAILLVDYTNTLRQRGLERNAALLEAGPTRLRPILMTTIAMVLAMSPLALGVDEGSEWRAPMAITVIGGLITSTLLTLVMIPAVYTILDDASRLPGRTVRLFKRIIGRAPAREPSIPIPSAPAVPGPRDEPREESRPRARAPIPGVSGGSE